MWAAVNRQTETGIVLADRERVTSEQAVMMYTINAAYTCFEEKIKDSIEPGKLADMVVLSDDPTKVPPKTIKDIKVIMTFVNGGIAYEAT